MKGVSFVLWLMLDNERFEGMYLMLDRKRGESLAEEYYYQSLLAFSPVVSLLRFHSS
jgi:hypothetical protein